MAGKHHTDTSVNTERSLALTPCIPDNTNQSPLHCYINFVFQDVLNLLLEYIELRGLRVVDFFRQLDKDNSKKISRAEFMNGVKKAGIPMTRKQLKKLVRVLDTDNDGTIDYGEMIAIKRDDVFDFYHKKKVYKKDDPQLQSFKSAQQKKP